MSISEEASMMAMQMALAAAIDGSINPKEPIQDRFTTTWNGLFDPKALAFGLVLGSVQELKDENGNIHYKIDGNYSEKVAIFNLVADDFERRRHASDQELHTGDQLGEQETADDWRDITRGAKLRLLQHVDGLTKYMLSGLHGVRVELEKGSPNDTSEATRSIVDRAIKWGISRGDAMKTLTQDLRYLMTLRKMCQTMDMMVREETNEGWEWATGLDKQVHLYCVIRDAWWSKLSRFFWLYALCLLKPGTDSFMADMLRILDNEEIYKASKVELRKMYDEEKK